jgi:hypothetical protein
MFLGYVEKQSSFKINSKEDNYFFWLECKFILRLKDIRVWGSRMSFSDRFEELAPFPVDKFRG